MVRRRFRSSGASTTAAAVPVVNPASTAVAAASQVRASASFHSQGVALMSPLAAGIRAGAGAAVRAVTDGAQQLRCDNRKG